MFTQRPTDQHRHTFKLAYKSDAPQSHDEAKKYHQYNKGARYLLMRVCTTCPYKETYDLTHQKPGKEK